ncbi:TRAP transporter large permease [Cloacibacillus evryensis]|uniref:TRAP transporter large permease n=1 Tax=Cloacibacillus evryensis TaxID=508460 RepID=UPI00241EDE42|nr:TRAP transporter large permease [Cloacibacillus evryensis]
MLPFAVVVIIFGLLIGMYLPYVFVLAALFLIHSIGYEDSFLIKYGYSVCNSLVLLCVPLFIAVGLVMERSGIGKCLVNFVGIFVGRIKGGLAVVAVVACAAFGSIAGSSLATLSCISSIMLPRFEENGYPKAYVATLLTSACPLGLLIPPSAHMILYSWAGRQPLLACFLATVGPGIMLVILLSTVSLIILRNDPNIKVRPKIPAKDFIKMAKDDTAAAIPALLMPVIVLGGIYSGTFTPTEAAAVAIIYSIPVGFFVYKQLTIKKLYHTFVETASTTGVIMVMIFCVMMLSRIYIMEDMPGMIADFLRSFSDDKTIILLGVNIVVLIMGMIMDDTSCLLLGTPILLPVVQSFGVDPIHFAAIMGVNVAIGLLTPPTAPALYFGIQVTRTPLSAMLKPNLILLITCWLPTLIAVTYFPDLALWLPRLVLGN